MNKIHICNLYGNLMNTYGDYGNLLMLQHYARKQGFEVETEVISLNESFDSDKYDIVLFGGGQDLEQYVVSLDLPNKRDDIKQYIDNNGVMLAVCGGFQLLGEYYINSKGTRLEGLNILPHYTERQINRRFIGDVKIYDEINDQTYVGFENHNGVTYLKEPLKPLGKIIEGNGNNGQDGTEGVHYKNVFGTYLHGPILVRNEWLANHLVTLAIQQRQ